MPIWELEALEQRYYILLHIRMWIRFHILDIGCRPRVLYLNLYNVAVLPIASDIVCSELRLSCKSKYRQDQLLDSFPSYRTLVLSDPEPDQERSVTTNYLICLQHAFFLAFLEVVSITRGRAVSS